MLEKSSASFSVRNNIFFQLINLSEFQVNICCKMLVMINYSKRGHVYLDMVLDQHQAIVADIYMKVSFFNQYQMYQYHNNEQVLNFRHEYKKKRKCLIEIKLTAMISCFLPICKHCPTHAVLVG